jgi:hypothetical protein
MRLVQENRTPGQQRRVLFSCLVRQRLRRKLAWTAKVNENYWRNKIKKKFKLTFHIQYCAKLNLLITQRKNKMIDKSKSSERENSFGKSALNFIREDDSRL